MADVYFSLLLLNPLSLLHFIVRPRSVRVPIKNRHVFITGGSGGIGLALAHLCAREGANVTIAQLEEAKQSIKLATGREVSVFSADVRDYDAVERVIQEAAAIDVLVCNHGVFIAQELEGQEMEEIKFMMDVNLMGSFHLIKAALPGMKKSRAERGPGSIAIMSSQAGQVGIYGFTAYSANTETPGFVRESKRRPQLTRTIAASSGAMKADEVAKKSLNGIQSGAFIIPCNLEGFLLSVATAGLSPQRSYLMAFVEVITAGIIRLTALFFQWNWYRSIEKQLADKLMSVRKNT
ncbi:3-dehydrosphinganine reductase TSC10A [Sesamum angolense]|uniref:3-dehydrosphinganine reductase TSC10A n=1 Tax=Sesamum angolense TaxID=2727404 RepID=A0AAE1X6K0_9LAMI|nr:3-dehydrosphinganine reductase TSC10A [Sesamum angolense]